MKGQFTTLLKREFWEHRSLWIAPLVAAGFFVIVSILGAIACRHALQHGQSRPHGRTWAGAMTTRCWWACCGMAGPLFLVSCITIVVYLLDCLYAERKDRSILFWKSLPVSDALTVLSKFTAGHGHRAAGRVRPDAGLPCVHGHRAVHRRRRASAS